MAIGSRATGLTGFRNSTGQTVYVEAAGMSDMELGPGGSYAARNAWAASLDTVPTNAEDLRSYRWRWRNSSYAQGLADAQESRLGLK